MKAGLSACEGEGSVSLADVPAAGERVAPGLALAEGPDTLAIHTY